MTLESPLGSVPVHMFTPRLANVMPQPHWNLLSGSMKVGHKVVTVLHKNVWSLYVVWGGKQIILAWLVLPRL